MGEPNTAEPFMSILSRHSTSQPPSKWWSTIQFTLIIALSGPRARNFGILEIFLGNESLYRAANRVPQVLEYNHTRRQCHLQSVHHPHAGSSPFYKSPASLYTSRFKGIQHQCALQEV